MPKRTAFEDIGGIMQRGTQLRDAALADAHIGSDVALEDNDSAVSARPTLDSESVFDWLQTWAWGNMSSIAVQKEALRSHNDYQIMLTCIPLNEEYMPRRLYSLAQLGNWGARTGNVNRELQTVAWRAHSSNCKDSHSANVSSKASHW